MRRRRSYCGSPYLSRMFRQTNRRRHIALLPLEVLGLCSLGTEQLSRLRHRHLLLLLIATLSKYHPFCSWPLDHWGSSALPLVTDLEMRSVNSTPRAPTLN